MHAATMKPVINPKKNSITLSFLSLSGVAQLGIHGM